MAPLGCKDISLQILPLAPSKMAEGQDVLIDSPMGSDGSGTRAKLSMVGHFHFPEVAGSESPQLPLTGKHMCSSVVHIWSNEWRPSLPRWTRIPKLQGGLMNGQPSFPAEHTAPSHKWACGREPPHRPKFVWKMVDLEGNALTRAPTIRP
ncbi:uncharacterized protein BDR25DRAFT_349502 [Lindgomyces ingoldianus]|uniref:Uncharacterized protein n=1 Tax=Lindgomyces ingoldianus TaxID=673940 RepID=A0ACB6RDI7_9PLEO|nr:uncharacterized protein BDR25DRAFT_349502 [Lindgomyces ingoldianus]KAF2476392.1 hypothetical protein BDR25DRAFT_349502 [Lindgomyces ingoldianus]